DEGRDRGDAAGGGRRCDQPDADRGCPADARYGARPRKRTRLPHGLVARHQRRRRARVPVRRRNRCGWWRCAAPDGRCARAQPWGVFAAHGAQAVARTASRGGRAGAPKWMRALDRLTPLRAAGAAVLLSAANPKNLLLGFAGAAVIARAGISGGQRTIAFALFALIASLGVGAPVALYFALGERSRRMLDALKGWMARNSAVIMAVLLLAIGARLI